MHYAEIIKAKRDELDLSQPKFAKLVGVNQSTIWRWESGKRQSPPSKATLAFIASLKAKRVKA